MNILSQVDYRWKNKPLGTTGLTIGEAGCTMTCLCMMLGDFGFNVTPDVLAANMTANGGLDSNDYIIWQKLESLYPVTFLGRDYAVAPDGFKPQLVTSEALRRRADKLARIGQPALLAVKLGSNLAKPNHFVIRDPNAKGEFVIVDPAFGDRIEFRSRYGDPDHQIWGLARFFGNPVNPPDADLSVIAFKLNEMQKKPETVETYRHEMFNDLTR